MKTDQPFADGLPTTSEPQVRSKDWLDDADKWCPVLLMSGAFGIALMLTGNWRLTIGYALFQFAKSIGTKVNDRLKAKSSNDQALRPARSPEQKGNDEK